MIGRKLGFLEKAVVFIVSFFIVIFFGVQFRIWSIEWTMYLFRADKWLELLFVLCIATGITMLLSKLLEFEFHFQRTH